MAGRGGVPLELDVMSATADTEALLRFFKTNDSKATGDSDGEVREDNASDFERCSDDECI